MTDNEERRARMREAAEKATPGPWTRRDTPDYAEMIGEDESRPLALVGKPEDADFIALASPANVKALDAEITRLREDNDWLRGVAKRAVEQMDEARAALAKRDEEVAGLRVALADYHAALKVREHAGIAGMRLIQAVEATLTKEPTNA